MGVPPMFAVLRDIDRYSDQSSNRGAIFFVIITTPVAALELDWLEYQPMRRSPLAMGKMPMPRYSLPNCSYIPPLYCHGFR